MSARPSGPGRTAPSRAKRAMALRPGSGAVRRSWKDRGHTLRSAGGRGSASGGGGGGEGGGGGAAGPPGGGGESGCCGIEEGPLAEGRRGGRRRTTPRGSK